MTTGTDQQDAGNSQRAGGAGRGTLILALLLVVGVLVAEVIGAPFPVAWRSSRMPVTCWPPPRPLA